MNSRRHHAQKPQPTSHNTQSRTIHNVVDPPFLTRSLKRKKSSSFLGPSSPGHNGRNSDKAENRVPAAASKSTVISSLSRRPSSRVFDAMGRPPLLERDLLVRAPSKKDKGIIEDQTPLRGRHNDVDEAQTAAEHKRMKKEIETLKESLLESKNLCRRQAKQLEESRTEANAAVKAMKDREIELAEVKSTCRKNEQLLSTIETSVQCQICMDLPDKPFALNPCGHILCLSCLQEWFRKAPPTLDDMDVDPDELTDPQYTLMRSKTCPSCRALVKYRPVPVFMIKSVVTVLKKVKSPHASSPASRHDLTEDNPWKGIFASSEEDGDDEESPLESDSDGLDVWFRHSHIAHFETAVGGNASAESELEDEEEEDNDGYDDDNLYTLPRWAPPSVSVTDYEFVDDDVPDTLKLLQRGCSWDMLQNFDVSYSHRSGIVVSLRSLNRLYASDDDEDEGANDINMHRVFLGWNISLHPGDIDGEDYMQDILREIKNIPERWQVTLSPQVPYSMDARRLVCVDDAEEFDTTDTEAWIDNEDL